MGAHENLDELYAKQRLLTDETARLEEERDRLDSNAPDKNRQYFMGLQIEALRQESTRISAHISDILERDLQR
jgi:hypothetical protein